MAIRGYHSYRGRRTGRRGLVIVLLVLVLLLACAFLYSLRYVTYADDGSLRLDLPFFREEEAPPVDPPREEDGGAGPDMNLVIDEPEPEPPEEPEVEPYGAHRLLEIPALPEDGEILRTELEQQGANGFVYTVRDNTGRVFYESASAISSAVAEGAASGEELSAICGQEDVISVARINCFHDSYYAWANMESAGICQSTGYIWYDNLSYHWLDPDKEAARNYVTDLALECAQMGFDELLLEEMCYPSAGKLGKIDYSRSTMGKSEALERFLTGLREALEPYDIRICLLLDQRLLSAESSEYEENSGQKLDRLLPLVDAVYVRTEDPAGAEEALVAAAGEAAPPLIPVVGEPGAGESWYIPLS